jgi:putative ABC transport system ATP-binding protein
MTNEKSFIELQNLTKIYREGKSDRTVLRNITATVNRGDVIVLLGRSGSGKSTLLNLLCGIDIPSSGQVCINNIAITGLSEHKRTLFRRKHIGFIFQFFNLIPTLTVEENLLLPLELNGLTGIDEEKKAFELLDMTGLSDRRKSYPEQLSGGEQQRVAIARALSHDPMIILADEPTGNLDFETGSNILSLLQTLAVQSGKTMIIATHSKEMVCSSFQKVRVITLNGRGSIEELHDERVTGKL